MRKKAKKRIPLIFKKPWRVVVIAALLLGIAAPNAVAAIDIKKFTDSLIEQLKNNVVISSIVKEINNISDIFLPALKNLTNLTDADISTIKGVLGQISPTEAKEAIENKSDPENPLSDIYNTDVIALVTSDLAAQQVLSKAAQEANNKKIEETIELVGNSKDVAVGSMTNADEAQVASSSQDVLKLLAKQTGNQVSVNAAQVRIAALQNSNLQEIKTQLAALNQVNASFEKRQQGEKQAQLIRDNQKTSSYARSKTINYLQGFSN